MKRSWWGIAVAAPAAVCTALLALPASAVTATPVNIIKNPGAEAGLGSPDGSTVKVPDWTVQKGATFTAVQYGASGGFPDKSTPGPANRGRNFFAGGPDSKGSSATQTDSLASYRKIIASGADFSLRGWLGGYGDQGDHTTVTIAWENASGTVLTTSSIGPVGAGMRHNKTKFVLVTAGGNVPGTTAKVVVTMTMVRKAGAYCDGYADNLSLTIEASSG